MKQYILLLLLIVLMAPSFAQQKNFTPGHIKAAEELMVVVNVDRQLQEFPKMYIATILKQNPALQTFEDIFLSFFEKHLSYDKLKGEFAAMYAEAFTEKELKEITAFYQSPTGKKAVEQMPLLMQKGMEIGNRIFEENRMELQQLMEKRVTEEQTETSID